ncbi:MAG: LamG-like jellyroll fold domain-containing protein [Planctomycetota bacterium]
MPGPDEGNTSQTSKNGEQHDCSGSCKCPKDPCPEGCCDKDCPPPDSQKSCNSDASDCSDDPISFAYGHIRHSDTGLSFGVPGMTHGRAYRNRFFSLAREQTPPLEPISRSPVGNNWDVTEWSYLTRRIKDGNTSIMARVGGSTVWFDQASGASVFTARFFAEDTYAITHDAGNQRYTVTQQTGQGVSTWVFQDFTNNPPDNVNPNPWGALISKTDTDGYTTTVTSYTGSYIDKLQCVRGTSTFEFDYDYLSSGVNAGYLEHVTATEDSGSGAQPIRRMRYEFYDGVTETDYGLQGDLKAAILQQPDGSGGWEDIEVTYYRYYTQSFQQEAGGFPHGLRYVVEPSTYAELIEAGQDPLAGAPSGGGEDLVPYYADIAFTYDGQRRVIAEVTRNCSACGSGGGTGQNGTTLTRSLNPNYPTGTTSDVRPNFWMWKVVEDSGRGYFKTIYTNRSGQPILTVKKDKSSTREWSIYQRFDDRNRIVLIAEPSAVLGYDESLPDLVGNFSPTGYTYLKPDDGLIRTNTFYASTTATPTTAGGVTGYIEFERLQKGTAGTPINQSKKTYMESGNTSGDTTYVPASVTTYPDADASGGAGREIVTSMAYTWYADRAQVQEKTTSLPAIPGAQNGDGTSATTKEYFDANGRLTWRMDERGIIDQMEYDDARSLLIKQTRDVSTVPNPPGWTPTSGGHEDQVTEYRYDNLGRMTLELGPEHEADVNGTPTTLRTITNRLYIQSPVSAQSLNSPQVDDETWDAQGYATGPAGSESFTLIDPVQITLHDKKGRTTNQIRSKRSTGTGLLSDTDAFFRGDWSAWSTMRYSLQGQLVDQKDYHSIPAQSPDLGLGGIHSDLGTEGTNFYTSLTGYDRQSNLPLRSVSPTGTITRTVYDGIERPVATYTGTDDTPDPIPGITGHWPLDAGSGTTADDTSGSTPPNNGTINGATWTQGPVCPANGQITNALSFDGTNDSVTTPYAGIGGALARTVSFWIKTNQTTWGTAIHWGVSGQDGKKWQIVLNQSDGTVGGIRIGVAAGYKISTKAVNDGTWHHVAAVLDPAQGTNVTDTEIYIDGIREQASGELAQAIDTDTSTNTVRLGIDELGSAALNGSLCDVRIYDRALSAAEVREIASYAQYRRTWRQWTPGSSSPTTDGTNLKLIASMQYDDGNGGGLSNLTSTTAHLDSDPSRITRHLYDFRGRRVITDGEETLYTTTTYDNLSRVTQTTSRNTTAAGKLEAQTDTAYDDRNRVYRTTVHGIDPTDGSLSGQLVGNNTYDPAGNLIHQTNPGDSAAYSKFEYDNLNRQTRALLAYENSSSVEIVVEDALTTINEADLPITLTQKQIDTGTHGASGGPTYRDSYTFQYFDPLTRQIAVADYGAPGSTPTRPASIPTRSNDILVTTMEYDDAGRNHETTDPKALVTLREYDALDRETALIENYVSPGTPTDSTNRTTQTTYTADGQAATLTAVMPGSTPNQVTTYHYGVDIPSGGGTSKIADNSLLSRIEYPESPSGGGCIFAYNRQAEVFCKYDRNGTKHLYSYDKLGRPTQDKVTVFGTLGPSNPGIHEGIKRLTTQYNSRGLVASSRSHISMGDDPNHGVTNEVRFAYDAFNNLKTSWQQPDSAVDEATSQKVQYTHAQGTAGTGVTNTTRLESMTYPDGRQLVTDYLTDSNHDKLGRPRFLRTNGPSSQTIADYGYLGRSFVTQVGLPNTTDFVAMRLWDFQNPGSYPGLDRFNRVTDQHWATTQTSPVTKSRHKYGYDRNSNRLYREDVVAKSLSTPKYFDEFYTIDGLNRLSQYERGEFTPTSGPPYTGTTNGSLEEVWQLDPLGNWKNYDRSASTDLIQVRTHNTENQITAIDNGQTPDWATPQYDGEGNTTAFPRPDDPTQAFTAQYDAWNRLVWIKTDEGANPPKRVAFYCYDALGRRITEAAYNTTTLKLTHSDTVYYSQHWQRLETHRQTAGASSSQLYQQMVYHAPAVAYVDQLCEQQTDTTSGGGNGVLDETLYFLQDDLYNVTAVIDDSAEVQQRYAYTPYGSREILDANYDPDTTPLTPYSQQGLAIDPATALFENRARVRSTVLGRFLQEDAEGYIDGMNLFASYHIMHGKLDPSGLAAAQVTAKVGGPDKCRHLVQTCIDTHIGNYFWNYWSERERVNWMWATGAWNAQGRTRAAETLMKQFKDKTLDLIEKCCDVLDKHEDCEDCKCNIIPGRLEIGPKLPWELQKGLFGIKRHEAFQPEHPEVKIEDTEWYYKDA